MPFGKTVSMRGAGLEKGQVVGGRVSLCSLWCLEEINCGLSLTLGQTSYGSQIETP